MKGHLIPSWPPLRQPSSGAQRSTRERVRKTGRRGESRALADARAMDGRADPRHEVKDTERRAKYCAPVRLQLLAPPANRNIWCDGRSGGPPPVFSTNKTNNSVVLPGGPLPPFFQKQFRCALAPARGPPTQFPEVRMGTLKSVSRSSPALQAGRGRPYGFHARGIGTHRRKHPAGARPAEEASLTGTTRSAASTS
jgi:hypothetical protein